MSEDDMQASEAASLMALAMTDAVPGSMTQPPVFGTLEAVVQAHMTFNGKRRQPGDILSPEELATTTHVTLGALKNQNLITLQPEGAHRHQKGVAAELEEFEDRLAQAEAVIEGQNTKIDAMTHEIASLKASLGQAIEAAITRREMLATNDPSALLGVSGKKPKGA